MNQFFVFSLLCSVFFLLSSFCRSFFLLSKTNPASLLGSSRSRTRRRSRHRSSSSSPGRRSGAAAGALSAAAVVLLPENVTAPRVAPRLAAPPVFPREPVERRLPGRAPIVHPLKPPGPDLLSSIGSSAGSPLLALQALLLGVGAVVNSQFQEPLVGPQPAVRRGHPPSLLGRDLVERDRERGQAVAGRVGRRRGAAPEEDVLLGRR